MNRWLPYQIVAGLFGGFGLLLLLFAGWASREQVTTCRLSPDETLRVWLVEKHMGFRLDRNFAIRLENLSNGETVALLPGSPDEGTPEGTERFLWSKDGTKVLLIGRHFFVREDLLLNNGDQAYFLHDVRSGRSWINAAYTDRFPPLTANLITGVEFTEPVVLKPRPKVDPDSPKKGE